MKRWTLVMKRWTLALVALLAVSAAARAHFLWIIPDGGKAQVVFSDKLGPDAPELLTRIAHAKVYLRDAAGKTSPGTWTKAEKAYVVDLGTGDAQTVGVSCTYGVLKRGEDKPFLLTYYAKLARDVKDGAKAWDAMALDIVPTTPEARRFVVLWNGKPLANAEVAVIAPGAEKEKSLKADANGEFALPEAKPGRYGLRAVAVENKAGEHEGKKYDAVRTYATLVLDIGTPQASGRPERKPDAAATRLLAEARAARAEWVNFPGFTADVEVNLQGRLSHGRVAVDPQGKVTITGLERDAAAEAWAKRTLGSVCGHRLSGAASLETPCAFADVDANHPLGRRVLVLNDEMHSSYRIRDRQIVVVERLMQGTKFVITTLENRTNAENKFLPASFVVHYWDPQTGALTKTESTTQTWLRLEKPGVGRFDLPLAVQVITAGKEVSANSLTLSGHRLVEAK